MTRSKKHPVLVTAPDGPAAPKGPHRPAKQTPSSPSSARPSTKSSNKHPGAVFLVRNKDELKACKRLTEIRREAVWPFTGKLEAAQCDGQLARGPPASASLAERRHYKTQEAALFAQWHLVLQNQRLLYAYTIFNMNDVPLKITEFVRCNAETHPVEYAALLVHRSILARAAFVRAVEDASWELYTDHVRSISAQVIFTMRDVEEVRRVRKILNVLSMDGCTWVDTSYLVCRASDAWSFIVVRNTWRVGTKLYRWSDTFYCNASVRGGFFGMMDRRDDYALLDKRLFAWIFGASECRRWRDRLAPWHHLEMPELTEMRQYVDELAVLTASLRPYWDEWKTTSSKDILATISEVTGEMHPSWQDEKRIAKTSTTPMSARLERHFVDAQILAKGDARRCFVLSGSSYSTETFQTAAPNTTQTRAVELLRSIQGLFGTGTKMQKVS